MPCWSVGDFSYSHNKYGSPKDYKNIIIKKKNIELILKSPKMWVDEKLKGTSQESIGKFLPLY